MIHPHSLLKHRFLRVALITTIIVGSLCFCSIVSTATVKAKEPPLSRIDAFTLLWKSIARPALSVSEKPYADIPKSHPLYSDLLYAKDRGITGEYDTFRPGDPVDFETAMTWLFRTRSIEAADSKATIASTKPIDPDAVPGILAKYGMAGNDAKSAVTQTQLLNAMRYIDSKLMEEEHEVSLYSEKFHGAGTAFGETFDMNTFTAAHRTFPYNTLVMVTNTANGKSVIVRINDRGPFVPGRDMDLSLKSFTTIANRSEGKIMARFERLGDISIFQRCNDTRFQRRITKDVVLNPGLPHSLALGKSITLMAGKFFVVESVTYPDGTIADGQQWIAPGEAFSLTPSVTGTYIFYLRDPQGYSRTMQTDVIDCSGQQNQ